MSAWSAAVVLTITFGCTVSHAEASFEVASEPTIRAAQDESLLHIDAGGRLFEQRDLEGAAREFREAIRLSPLNPMPHNNLGMILHLQGQPEAALVEFRESVALNPGSAPAWSNLGFAFFELEQLIPAMEAWRIAVDLNQQMAGTWAGLALGLFAGGHGDQASESYRKAIHLDPHYADLADLQTVRHWSVRALNHADMILRVLAARQQAYLSVSLM
ncbi:MAG: tetratricopeptide repeat protein [Nitrospira sp.]|nr:tetratricopeptide repeat protein [Nitrospira sp.]